MKDTKVLMHLRDLDMSELRQQFGFMSRELLTLRMQMRTSHVSDYSRVGKLRKMIARIATILSEKEQAKRAEKKI